MINAQSIENLRSKLPQRISSWQLKEEHIYDHQNLFEYINGGAELYLSYGFLNVSSREYMSEGEPSIFLDIFDMSNPKNAFGVFSHSRETIQATFGQGSQYTAGLLLFWKDHYFVSILAHPETEASKKAVFWLARQIETAIGTEGSLPEILSLLPQVSLVKESIRYFRHYIWLNSYYFVAHENILGIDENTDALLAKYGDQQQRHLLLIVKYPTEKDAKIAYRDFVKHYLPELSGDVAPQVGDHEQRNGFRRRDRRAAEVTDHEPPDGSRHEVGQQEERRGDQKEPRLR